MDTIALRKMLRVMAPAPEKFDMDAATVKSCLPTDFDLSDIIVNQLCAALNSGKHLLLVGAPGTGKTTIAQALCKAARRKLLAFGDGILTTATADWTTFDTVGGYFPDSDEPGKVVFTPGVVIRGLESHQWVVIDEINRADIDKAVGAVFSMLSRQEVVLPQKGPSGDNIQIRPGIAESTEQTYFVHPHWRLLATMNDFDKTSLYDISYALMRRFAVIRIPTPTPVKIQEIIKAQVPKCDLSKGLKQLTEISVYRDVGPAVFIDMARYIVTRSPSSQSGMETLEAFTFFLWPQLLGLSVKERAPIDKVVKAVFGKFDWDAGPQLDYGNGAVPGDSPVASADSPDEAGDASPEEGPAGTFPSNSSEKESGDKSDPAQPGE